LPLGKPREKIQNIAAENKPLFSKRDNPQALLHGMAESSMLPTECGT
jgi:hypothetical protein